MECKKKEIVPIGQHLVSDTKGNRKLVTITPERAQKWVETFKLMKQEGLNVYAPWEHDFSSKPVKNIEELLNAKNNGGTWKDIYIENGSIWGEIEPATEADDENIGTKVHGCSIYVDNYVDGSGREWEDAILHICLTNKPVAVTGDYMPVNQENSLSIAMSTSVKANSNPGIISNLLETLKKIGIMLSPTDDVDELLKMLTVALDNSPLKDSVTGGIPGGVSPKAPRLDLVMSTDVKTPETPTEPAEKDNVIADKILKQNDTLKTENSDLAKKLEKFNAFFSAQAKKDLVEKINRISEAVGNDADGKKLVKQLKDQLDSTEFSFDENGDVVRNALHSEVDLHLKYLAKPAKKVAENSDKVPSNVQEKSVEEEPNDDPRFIDPAKIATLVASMPL